MGLDPGNCRNLYRLRGKECAARRPDLDPAQLVLAGGSGSRSCRGHRGSGCVPALVMDYVLQQGGGWVVQVLASGSAFGLPHGIFGPIKRNAMAAFRAATITRILGALLGAVYLIGGRSLAPGITAHFLITLALEPGLLIVAVTNEWRFETTSPEHDKILAD